MKYLLVGVGSVLLSIGVCYFVLRPDKTAYVYSDTIFKGFKGTLQLEEKLQVKRNLHKKVLDSLMGEIASGNKALIKVYDQQAQAFSLDEKTSLEKYNEDLWKYINQRIKEYGEKNDFDFIYGALGDGNLMYAREKKDVTNEVLKFVNESYSE